MRGNNQSKERTGQLVLKQKMRHDKKPLSKIPKPATFSSHSSSEVTADTGRIGASEILVPKKVSARSSAATTVGQSSNQKTALEGKTEWNFSTKPTVPESSTKANLPGKEDNNGARTTANTVRRYR